MSINTSYLYEVYNCTCNVYILILVPKYSDLRQGEILRISEDLSPLFDNKAPQVSGLGGSGSYELAIADIIH